MNSLFQPARTDSERRLRERIFNVLPAASFHLDRLLQLLDVVESYRSPTACIECSTQPRLHLNPDFVTEYCAEDEALFVLILHELYHVILGHTRLFPRSTPVHNFVFDTVINAMICQQFPDPRYTGFFQRVNSWETVFGRLLRPPPGWPDQPEPLPASASRAERRAMSLLYGKDGKDKGACTYLDVFQAIVEHLALIDGGENGGQLPGGVILLGDHSGQNASGADDETVLNDEMLRQVFRRIVESWPPPPKPIAGRDEGRSPEEIFLTEAGQPDARFLSSLGRLLRRTGILKASPVVSRQTRKRMEVEREYLTVMPQLCDRRSAAWKLLVGSRPLFYQAVGVHPRAVFTPQAVSHAYLDISGSMASLLPLLGRGLDGPHRRGQLRLYVFSTVVDAVNARRPLAGQPLKNTHGTEINCVLKHLVALNPAATPRRVLILTDGYTGQPRLDLLRELKNRGVKLYIGLVGGSVSHELQPFAEHVEVLPSLTL